MIKLHRAYLSAFSQDKKQEANPTASTGSQAMDFSLIKSLMIMLSEKATYCTNASRPCHALNM
jgi:hypothetical protein